MLCQTVTELQAKCHAIKACIDIVSLFNQQSSLPGFPFKQTFFVINHVQYLNTDDNDDNNNNNDNN